MDKEDLIQEILRHLLEKASSYDPTRASYEDWVFFQALHWLQSHFRKSANRHRLRSELATQRSGRKGIRRPWGLIDNPTSPGDWGDHLHDPTFGEGRGGRTLEDAAFDETDAVADGLPEIQRRMDLDEQIAKLPEKQRQVITFVLAGDADDIIGWRMKLHPATVSSIRLAATATLREKLCETRPD